MRFGIPTLVVEDILKKLNLYLHSGIKEYWIVNLMRKEVYTYLFAGQYIQEYRVHKESETVQSLTFDDLAVSLERVYPPL